MFKHWQRVPERATTAARGVGAAVAAAYRVVVSRSSLQFIHITAGAALVAWGLEAVLPFTVWRICAGAYVLSWAGWRFLGTLFWRGVYVLSGDDS